MPSEDNKWRFALGMLMFLPVLVLKLVSIENMALRSTQNFYFNESTIELITAGNLASL